MKFPSRMMLLGAIDIFLISAGIGAAYILRFDGTIPAAYVRNAAETVLAGIPVHLSSMHFFRLYKRVWRYASVGELVSILRAIGTGTVLMTVFDTFLLHLGTPRSIYVISGMAILLLIGGSRFVWRLFRGTYSKIQPHQRKALIIGAGESGTLVIKQLKRQKQAEFYPVAFLDDDPRKHGMQIMGIPVLGGREKLHKVVRKFDIENIVIAIPSLRRNELHRLVQECSKTKAKTQIVPKLEDLMLGKVSINAFRDVDIEDLLGREPVELDSPSIARYISGSVVLVTGAGGSIGSEICRQVAQFSPSRLILLGHGENSIYEIERELKQKAPESTEYITIIADIQDRDKMFRTMETYAPRVVFHAAAHKHVPLMERNPEEAVKNNIMGTKNVAEAAHQAGVNVFVMISTDKAVKPTSVMGATKRIAEMVIQDLDKRSKTRFVAVRFGNVLGSRGSVVQIFKEQIQRGGPVTVTHPEMVRYFMTIPEASGLVLQAGALAKGGEIFVLDMGDPVRIVDLAKNMIRLSGLTEDEITIRFTGIRPGEKLFEELLNEEEVHEEQIYPKIYVGKATVRDSMSIDDLLETYQDLTSPQLKAKMMAIIHEAKNAENVLAI